jgi:hypothetical protein
MSIKKAIKLCWIPVTFNLHRPSKKLSEKCLGPFEVLEKVGQSTYRLKLPLSWKIHPVFNELLLHPHVGPKFPGQDIYNKPPPELIDNKEEYKVEEILDTRIHRKRYEYQVRWKGYGPEDDTWEPESSLAHAPLAITEFNKKLSQQK